MRGNRPEDLLDRRDMLASALESLARSMSEATCDEPVGFVIDPTDCGGGRLATHLFAAKDKISVEEATTALGRLNDEHRAREESPTTSSIVIGSISFAPFGFGVFSQVA